MPPKARLLALAAVIAVAGFAVFYATKSRPPAVDDPKLTSSLQSVTAGFRRIVILMDGAESLSDAERARCRAAGRQIFYTKQQEIAAIWTDLSADYRNGGGHRVRQFLRWLAAPQSGLRDADKLAFLDILEELADPQPNKLADPVKAALEEVRSIQGAYREEVSRLFARLGTRGPEVTREKWDAYVAFLRGRESRASILSGFDDIISDELDPETRGQGPVRTNEVFGEDFPVKSVALTFDDGPHPKYTEQITAILKKYELRAAFFQLGVNLGTLEKDNAVKLSKNAEIVHRMLEAGHAIANHSYSHRALPRLTDTERATEIGNTNLLLTNLAGKKPLLFRPPYGARNQKIIDQLTEQGMQEPTTSTAWPFGCTGKRNTPKPSKPPVRR